VGRSMGKYPAKLFLKAVNPGIWTRNFPS
jgi:hypothetical protein